MIAASVFSVWLVVLLPVGVRRLLLELVFGVSGSFVWIAEMFVAGVVESKGYAGWSRVFVGFSCRSCWTEYWIAVIGYPKVGVTRLKCVMFLVSFVASRNVDIFPESSIYANNCSLYGGACLSIECMVALRASSSLSGIFIV